jgi:AAA15 family ATPase/GTPase
MINSITIRNYKSILDLTLDLTYAEGKAPNGWKNTDWLPFVSDGNEGRYVPVLAIYGANASGKSNVINALDTLRRVLLSGVNGNYQPNRLVPERQNAPSEFIVRLEINGCSYTYELVYDRECILEEKLSGRIGKSENRILFSVKEGELQEESLGNASYPLKRLEEICRVECHDEHGKQTKTFLYGVFKGYAGLSPELNAVVHEIVGKNVICPDNDIVVSLAIDRLVKLGNAENIQAAFDKILVYLKKLDIHIETMKLNRQSVPAESFDKYLAPDYPRNVVIRNTDDREHLTVERITSFHQRTDGVLEPFNFYADESQGTKLLAGLLGIVLEVLENGGRLFIDELDHSLHPLLLVQIARMFKSKVLNKKGAQLVFTLHETTLLEDPLLRLSEVGILNNNVHVGTTLARLVDYHKDDKTIRNVHNFRKRYLEGLYAGVPEPML